MSSSKQGGAQLRVRPRTDVPARIALDSQIDALSRTEWLELDAKLQSLGRTGLNEPAPRVTLNGRYEASVHPVPGTRYWLGIVVDMQAGPPKPALMLRLSSRAFGRDRLFHDARDALDLLNPTRQDH